MINTWLQSKIARIFIFLPAILLIIYYLIGLLDGQTFIGQHTTNTRPIYIIYTVIFVLLGYRILNSSDKKKMSDKLIASEFTLLLVFSFLLVVFSYGIALFISSFIK